MKCEIVRVLQLCWRHRLSGWDRRFRSQALDSAPGPQRVMHPSFGVKRHYRPSQVWREEGDALRQMKFCREVQEFRTRRSKWLTDGWGQPFQLVLPPHLLLLRLAPGAPHVSRYISILSDSVPDELSNNTTCVYDTLCVSVFDRTRGMVNNNNSS